MYYKRSSKQEFGIKKNHDTLLYDCEYLIPY